MLAFEANDNRLLVEIDLGEFLNDREDDWGDEDDEDEFDDDDDDNKFDVDESKLRMKANVSRTTSRSRSYSLYAFVWSCILIAICVVAKQKLK